MKRGPKSGRKIPAAKTPFTRRWERLRLGCIVGIVDDRGAVHSRFTGTTLEHHSKFWPTQTHSLWRWNWDRSIHCFVADRGLDAEQYAAVQNHLTRKHGLKWWDNGHHDIDAFLAEMRREGSRP